MARPDQTTHNRPYELEYHAPGKLIPSARNARTHSEAQIAQIAGSIREFGFTNPVLIDDDRGIIAGHGRVRAALVLELEEVPCVRLSTLTPTQRRLYMIADNRLAELAGWDRELLALELGDLKESGVSIDLSGFTESDLDVMLGDLDDGFNEDATDGSEQIDPYGVLLQLGPYRVKVDRDKFLKWEEEIRAIAGFDKDAIQAELARRVGL